MTVNAPITITVAAQKGGVGKTLMDTHLACYLRQVMDARVLVIDMDVSGVATRRLVLHDGVVPENVTTNVDCLTETDWVPAHGRFGIDVIPAFPGHDTHQQIHDLFTQDKHRLKQRIQSLPYDYVIIDGYPLLDARLEGCLLASDYVVSVGEPATDDIGGFTQVWSRLKELNESGYETPAHLGYIFNKVRGKSPIAMRKVRTLVKELGYLAFSNSITHRDPIANACDDSRLIWELPPSQARVASIEIEDVCAEILERIADDSDNGSYQHYAAELGGVG